MSTEIHPGVIAGVRMTTNQLTNDELNALYRAILLETDPRRTIGYDKVDTLFTEQNGTKMHQAVQAVFGAIWKERLG